MIVSGAGRERLNLLKMRHNGLALGIIPVLVEDDGFEGVGPISTFFLDLLSGFVEDFPILVCDDEDTWD